MSALADEILTALESPRGRKLITDCLSAALRQESTLPTADTIRKILSERDEDAVGGLTALASWIGAASADAARKRVERDAGLAALAFTVGKQRRWRRSEVLGWIARRGVR